MTANNYRIEGIRKARVNGRAVKIFNALQKNGGAFVFIGEFTAPIRKANRDLWKIAAINVDGGAE